MSAFGETDIGRVRSVNQDDFAVRDGGESPLGDALAAVADGMGGHAAGEVASEMSLALLIESLNGESAPGEDALRRAFARANAGVFREASAKPEYRGMGTTLVAALIAGGDMIIGNVGDSRMYLHRGGELRRVTQDHSWVGEMVAAGALTEEQAARHPRRNILTRALGVGASVESDVARMRLRRGDRIMLCSDGLHGMVDDKKIAEIIGARSLDLKKAARELIDLANGAGGTDNITVALARVDADLETAESADAEPQTRAGASDPLSAATLPPR